MRPISTPVPAARNQAAAGRLTSRPGGVRTHAMSGMTTCRTCGATIAATARTCPNCGANRNQLPGGAFAFVVIFGLLLFFLLAKH
jgi:hypothetical protein